MQSKNVGAFPTVDAIKWVLDEELPAAGCMLCAMEHVDIPCISISHAVIFDCAGASKPSTSAPRETRSDCNSV